MGDVESSTNGMYSAASGRSCCLAFEPPLKALPSCLAARLAARRAIAVGFSPEGLAAGCEGVVERRIGGAQTKQTTGECVAPYCSGLPAWELNVALMVSTRMTNLHTDSQCRALEA